MTVTRPPGNDIWRRRGARRDNFGGSGMEVAMAIKHMRRANLAVAEVSKVFIVG